MSRVRIYADVDGTLAADADRLTALPDGFTADSAFHPYARVLIAFHIGRIRRLAALSREADWLWLTSWGEKATESLAPLWGIEGSKSLPVGDRAGDPRQLWKLDMIQAIQTASPSRFVFLEDTALDEFTALDGGWWQEQVERGSALLIKSDEATGISDEQVAKIERFVADASPQS